MKNDTRFRFVIREEPIPAEYGPRKEMDAPEKLFEFFRDVVATDDSFERNKEQFVLMLLDSRLKLMGYQVISVGSLTETSGHPREILRPVIMAAAYGFAVMHNHPGGDPTPSAQDERWTRRMIEAADLLQLRFLDHVVVGNRNLIPYGRRPYYSFREAGIIV